jgi:cytochrome P450
MLPSGPRTPAFWQTLRFASAPREYSRKIARHGSAVRFRALNGKGVSVSDPELAREVFSADPAGFEALPVLGDLFGSRSVLATSGAIHKRQRKLLNPRFHGSHVRALLGVMQRVVGARLTDFARAAETGEVIAMADFGQALTLDVILETTFGASEGLDRAASRKMLQGLIQALSPLFVFAPLLRSPWFPPWRTFIRRRAAFDAWVDDLVAARRRAHVLGNDILGMLLEATYDDGAPMDDAEIREQLMTLLVAGHETTAVAFAWAVYFLLREPSSLARLRGELDALGPNAAPDAIVRLPYLGAVISETLRIEPVVTDVARVCRKPLALGKWQVPEGELALVNLSSILDNEELFPEPRRFRPERFLERNYSVGEFVPFGGGHRRCLGAAFAEAELATALAAIASHWELALASAEPERSVRRNITMGPKGRVRVRVVRRRPLAHVPGIGISSTISIEPSGIMK